MVVVKLFSSKQSFVKHILYEIVKEFRFIVNSEMGRYLKSAVYNQMVSLVVFKIFLVLLKIALSSTVIFAGKLLFGGSP